MLSIFRWLQKGQNQGANRQSSKHGITVILGFMFHFLKKQHSGHFRSF